jgi:hypothetical protein
MAIKIALAQALTQLLRILRYHQAMQFSCQHISQLELKEVLAQVRTALGDPILSDHAIPLAPKLRSPLQSGQFQVPGRIRQMIDQYRVQLLET